MSAEFTSTIAPDRVELATSAEGRASRGASVSLQGHFEYAQDFVLRFTLDAPTEFRLSATITRSSGWQFTDPASITFGLEGQAPIVSILHPGTNPFEPTMSFPQTMILLSPGAYLVEAHNRAQWTAGSAGLFQESMGFSLVAVPAPSGLVVAICAAAVVRRRRPDAERALIRTEPDTGEVP